MALLSSGRDGLLWHGQPNGFMVLALLNCQWMECFIKALSSQCSLFVQWLLGGAEEMHGSKAEIFERPNMQFPSFENQKHSS